MVSRPASLGAACKRNILSRLNTWVNLSTADFGVRKSRVGPSYQYEKNAGLVHLSLAALKAVNGKRFFVDAEEGL